jgi:hypothetical protein
MPGACGLLDTRGSGRWGVDGRGQEDQGAGNPKAKTGQSQPAMGDMGDMGAHPAPLVPHSSFVVIILSSSNCAISRPSCMRVGKSCANESQGCDVGSLKHFSRPFCHQISHRKVVGGGRQLMYFVMTVIHTDNPW